MTLTQDRAAISAFKDSFRQANGQLCFLLDYIPGDSLPGLEMSSFRRLSLFEEYFGLNNILLLTRDYQSNGVTNTKRQIELGRFASASVLNMYDYIQEVDRSGNAPTLPEQPLPSPWIVQPDGIHSRINNAQGHCVMYIRRLSSGEGIDYINFLDKGRIYRRDTYDIQGFLSRTEFIEPAQSFTYSMLFYRPDHTVALAVTRTPQSTDNSTPVIRSADLMDRQGRVTHRFNSERELISWWLQNLLSDRSKLYFLIGDQFWFYDQALRDIKQDSSYLNIISLPVSHGNHLKDPEDILSPIGANFPFFTDFSLRSDMVITLTERQKQDIEERLGTEAPPMTAIPHHLPVPIAGSTAEVGKSVLPSHSLIMVGRLVELKGHAHALSALKLILAKVPDTTLHFYGDGPLTAKLHSQTEEYGESDHVIFHSFATDLSPVYNSATLLLCCSYREGFSLVIQEALAHGCPVISFNCRYGPSDLVINAQNGYLVAPGDVSALAERTVQILKDDKLRARLSKGAVKSSERFSPLKIAALWAGLFNSLISQRQVAQEKS